MKRFIFYMRTLIIAVWPVTFLLISGSMERIVRKIATVNYEPKYYIFLAIFYVLSGLIFATIGSGGNAVNNRISIIISRVVAGILVFAYGMLWLVVMTGSIWNEFLANICSSTPINVLSLVFGYTLYSTVKTSVAYNLTRNRIRRQNEHRGA